MLSFKVQFFFVSATCASKLSSTVTRLTPTALFPNVRTTCAFFFPNIVEIGNQSNVEKHLAGNHSSPLTVVFPTLFGLNFW